jgi:cell division protein ZapA (FtsZ GTPase activity inhibitor)
MRDLASRAEVRAEQSIRKIAGYLQQKTTELRALNRSMEETRIQLVAQIDQLQELKEELNFNHSAAQNGEPLNAAQSSLAHLQSLTADAQRFANDLDSFGASPSAMEKPCDVGNSVEAAKRR